MSLNYDNCLVYQQRLYSVSYLSNINSKNCTKGSSPRYDDRPVSFVVDNRGRFVEAVSVAEVCVLWRHSCYNLCVEWLVSFTFICVLIIIISSGNTEVCVCMFKTVIQQNVKNSEISIIEGKSFTDFTNNLFMPDFVYVYSVYIPFEQN